MIYFVIAGVAVGFVMLATIIHILTGMLCQPYPNRSRAPDNGNAASPTHGPQQSASDIVLAADDIARPIK